MSRQVRQRLTIIATSDIHGLYLPLPATDKDKADGSLARAVAYADRLRADGENVIMLDCGDLFTDSAVSSFLDGYGYKNHPARMISAAGYDAVTPGNHDLQGTLRPLPCPLIVCNVQHPAVSPFAIIERGGWNVAVIGAVTDEQETLCNGIKISPSVPAIRSAIIKVKSICTPDLTIGLFHAGKDEIERIASAIAGLDVIIYGHDHKKNIFTTVSGCTAGNPGPFGKNILQISINDNGIEAGTVSLDKIPPSERFTSSLPVYELLNNISKPIATIGNITELETMLHKALLMETGAEITAIPPLHLETPCTLSLGTIYTILPYDDHAGITLMSGKELMGSGLRLAIHSDSHDIIPDKIYTVGADTFSIKPTLGISRHTIQHILAKILSEKDW